MTSVTGQATIDYPVTSVIATRRCWCEMGSEEEPCETQPRNKHEVDFNERPFIAIWEATQACDLACVHCRASAQPLRSAFELSTVEAQLLIEQIAAMQVPVFVITGGDPLKRSDIFDLVEYATARGVRTSLDPQRHASSDARRDCRSSAAGAGAFGGKPGWVNAEKRPVAVV